MRRTPLSPILILVMLIGGISVLFFTQRGSVPTAPPAPKAPVGPLLELAPRLRGLGKSVDAEVAARYLVDGALERGDGSPREAILEALVADDWGAQWAGVLAVPRYGPSDAALVRALEGPLTSDVAALRLTSATACAYVADGFDRLEPALHKLAVDPVATVRAAALRTLARRTRNRLTLLPLFVRGLENGAARGASAYGIAQIELQEQLTPEGVEAVFGPLLEATRDDLADVRMYAVMALGRGGALVAAGVPRMLELLDDENALVRSQASTALGSVGEAALPGIEAALDAVSPTRTPALMWALRLMGEPALPLLGASLRHVHPLVRVLAAQKLWEMDRQVEASVAVLIATLESSNDRAVLLAARILGRMGTEAAGARPALRALRTHTSESIRLAADVALEHLETQMNPK